MEIAGGESGETWQLAAKRRHRQTGFDDFIAAGEWLVANKVTSPARLGAMASSGGGMLVPAALDQRPDLFDAVSADRRRPRRALPSPHREPW